MLKRTEQAAIDAIILARLCDFASGAVPVVVLDPFFLAAFTVVGLFR
jgi:hypothetical protein